ncbi:MAG: UDP-3-O-(3-hydroxymyristoyl)glucosamine N-acyltransferase [Sphingomonadales bacterium]|nr:UDP-3-O-(3-hydroxymyristoyl)glucosamine N-acyltransferase [Sphingomonadales bacterium]
MQLPRPITLEEAAHFLQCRYIGPADASITGLNEIHKVRSGDLTFVDFHKYYQKALNSAADVVLIDQEPDNRNHKSLLISPRPFDDFNRLIHRYHQPTPIIGGRFYRGADVQIGKGTRIMEQVVLGDGVVVGRDCLIYPNVVIYPDTRIGDRVTIHSNTVIGQDAFYFKRKPEGYDKLLSCGRVLIQDDVEIGPCCTVSRGVSGDTIIGSGTKFDAQVHIGHGVEMGKNCLMAAQVGIGGKTIIGDEVKFWGQVGVQKDIRIGDGAEVLGQSGITKSIDGGKVYFGTPATDVLQVYREMAWLRSQARSKKQSSETEE